MERLQALKATLESEETQLKFLDGQVCSNPMYRELLLKQGIVSGLRHAINEMEKPVPVEGDNTGQPDNPPAVPPSQPEDNVLPMKRGKNGKK